MEAHALTQAQARACLEQFKLIDPAGRDTVADVVRGAQLVRLETLAGAVVLAMRPIGACMWICAAAGRTARSVASEVLAWVEAQARAQGLRRVGFQTVRKGLVRRVTALGYEALPFGAGWTLEKAL